MEPLSSLIRDLIRAPDLSVPQDVGLEASPLTSSIVPPELVSDCQPHLQLQDPEVAALAPKDRLRERPSPMSIKPLDLDGGGDILRGKTDPVMELVGAEFTGDQEQPGCNIREARGHRDDTERPRLLVAGDKPLERSLCDSALTVADTMHGMRLLGNFKRLWPAGPYIRRSWNGELMLRYPKHTHTRSCVVRDPYTTAPGPEDGGEKEGGEEEFCLLLNELDSEPQCLAMRLKRKADAPAQQKPTSPVTGLQKMGQTSGYIKQPAALVIIPTPTPRFRISPSIPFGMSRGGEGADAGWVKIDIGGGDTGTSSAPEHGWEWAGDMV